MKLCFLAGANSVHSHRWVRFFAERGHDVDWITLTPTIRPVRDEIRLHLLADVEPQSRVKRVWHAAAVRRLVRRIAPDVFHVHYAGFDGLVARMAGVHPLVVTAWGSDVLMADRSRLIKATVRSTLRAADLVTCDAQHMVRAMTALGVDPDRIAVIYFGTDIERFRFVQKDQQLLRELGVERTPVVISLRSLKPVYDIETLIRSTAIVVQSVPQAAFVICGDGPERAALEQLASSLGVASNISFVGAVPEEFLNRYLSIADVYVSTALSDAGLSASTAEAMASGVPVVVTDSGENRLWVEDGHNGYVVPCSDPSAMAESIVRLLTRPEDRRQFGVQARKVIEERNNYETEMTKMEALYAQLAGE